MRDLLTKGIVAQQCPTILTFVDVDVGNFKEKCIYQQANIFGTYGLKLCLADLLIEGLVARGQQGRTIQTIVDVDAGLYFTHQMEISFEIFCQVMSKG